MQPDDVEAVEEVLAEASVGDQLLEVGVGGGDDADVHLGRVWLAERMDLVVVEEAQELGLEVEADVADLVEEQRAARGGADHAGEGGVRAGEGAAAVAEQLAFEHVARHGAAVERLERAVGAVGGAVDRAGEHLLAGAGLPGDQDGQGNRRDAAGGRQQLGALLRRPDAFRVAVERLGGPERRAFVSRRGDTD